MIDWIYKHGGDRAISFLQETHSTDEIENSWKQMFNGEIIFSHGSSNSRGVAILFGNKLEYKILETLTDELGRFIIVKCRIEGNDILLINTYLSIYQ
jgi:hypothetical protein